MTNFQNTVDRGDYPSQWSGWRARIAFVWWRLSDRSDDELGAHPGWGLRSVLRRLRDAIKRRGTA